MIDSNVDFGNLNLSLKRTRIETLDYVLNYSVSSVTFLILYYFFPFFMMLIYLGILIFTPYLLYVLIKEKKNGWIAAFVIMVVLPFVIGLIFIPYSFVFTCAFGLFFLYCFLLKMATRDWVSDERARRNLEMVRRKKKIEQALFDSQFEKKDNS